MSDAQAHAAAEVAKTTGEIVKAAGGVGSYLALVFNSIPEDTLGLAVGDWLQHKRRRHLAELEANTARIIEDIAAERLDEPSPSVLIPLLKAAVDEGRPELQAMWAALLANAMVDGGRMVRRDYFEVVQQMEPSDALALEAAGRRVGDDDEGRAPGMPVDRECLRLGLSPNDQAISLNKLHRLGCVFDAFNWPVTPFGRGLLAACKQPE